MARGTRAPRPRNQTPPRRFPTQLSLYQEIFASAPDGALLIDPETQRLLEFNDAACRQLGYTREEFSGLRIADFEASQTPDEIRAHIQEALLTGIAEFETLHRTKTGQKRHVRVWAKTIDLDGYTVFQVVFRDITEYRQVETALRHSVDLLDHTGQLAKVGGWELDLETQVLRWTREVYRIHEVEPDYQPTVAEAIHFYGSEAQPIIRSAVEAAIDAGTPFDLELPLITARGRRIWVRSHGAAERRDGRTIRLSGAFQDITEQRRTDALRQLQSAALDAAADAIVITDRAGNIVWVNPAFSQLTGFTSDEAVGRNPSDLVKSGKHEQAFYQDLWSTILAGRVWRGVMTNRRKDGSLYTEEQVITPMRDAAQVITHFIAIKEDISDRLSLEAQYRQAQKMESVGRLASGIAHDFNNILTVINGMADLVLERLDPGDAAHADVQEIKHAGDRAATLTRQLLAFSRQQILAPQVMDLNAAVTGMVSLLKRLLGEDVDLVVVQSPDLGRVKADPGQIEQVITNLAVNARDAMPLGGTLTIETKNVELDDDYAGRHAESVPPGSYVLLAVTDTGTGMDDDTRARLFEPFFTTKARGKGTGLGLSTVHGIVKQTQGFIWVYSEPAHGTTFKVYLPVVTEAERPPRTKSGTISSATGTETVLLVEDNEGLRQLAARLLRRGGYTVLDEVSTAELALSVLASYSGPVHLLLTDVVLPGMSGRQLSEQLKQSRPDLRTLFMSGYTDDTIVRHGVLDQDMPFLNKPFTAATLLRRVRDVLDA
ncbi:MAG: PAS domain S-box protein [Vicinamibacterales bacterium]